MSYQSLLFCPDEKTARTVTQVLTELEFAVEPCSEPFAAVKKLMAEHFDAIVVDCDNEQNATLLFKSARNSTSNQASLAVAVVEGQAGVAKAFRIGANLVLTKPINVEQAKGTLRVARGLLRKGEPAKPVAPLGTTPAPLSTKTNIATPVPPVAAKPTVQPPSAGAPMPRPSALPAPWQVAKPAHSASSAATSSASAAHDQDVLDINGEVSAAASALNSAPAVPAASKPAVKNVPVSLNIATPVSSSLSSAETKAPLAQDLKSTTTSKAALSAGKTTFGTGAASAPAPARSGADPTVVEPTAFKEANAAEASFENAAESGMHEPSVSVTAAASPSFSYGGDDAAESSSGGSKKSLIGIAAAVVIAAGLYAGWTQFGGQATSISSDSRPTTSVPTATAQPNNSHPATPSTTVLPSTATPTTTSSPSPQTALQPKAAVKSAEAATVADNNDASAKDEEPGTKSSSKVSSSLPAAKPATAPIVMKKAGASPSQANAADTPAPSVMVAATSAGSPLPNLIGDPGASAKPVLQTLNVSQGVSQGLVIKKVQPTYPPNALRMHLEGSVLLLATIGKSGNITAVKTLNGEPTLARAALDAVKQWKYKPYYLNGEPVEIQTQITVNFMLPH